MESSSLKNELSLQLTQKDTFSLSTLLATLGGNVIRVLPPVLPLGGRQPETLQVVGLEVGNIGEEGVSRLTEDGSSL